MSNGRFFARCFTAGKGKIPDKIFAEQTRNSAIGFLVNVSGASSLERPVGSVQRDVILTRLRVDSHSRIIAEAYGA